MILISGIDTEMDRHLLVMIKKDIQNGNTGNYQMNNQIHETVYRLEYTNKYAVHPIYVPVYVHYTKSNKYLSIDI